MPPMNDKKLNWEHFGGGGGFVVVVVGTGGSEVEAVDDVGVLVVDVIVDVVVSVDVEVLRKKCEFKFVNLEIVLLTLWWHLWLMVE